MVDHDHIRSIFKGRLLTEPAAIEEKLFRVKAFVFDWDGVFNDGVKDAAGSSPFNEINSMGTNMLRFNHFLRKGHNPIVAIISGEHNKAAHTFARREHFHAVYSGIGHKKDALQHLCAAHHIQPHEVAFFFDDVLDLSMAEQCGLRMMMGRECNPLLTNLAAKNGLADYITAADGGNYGLREAIELLLGLSGKFDDTIMQRMHYTAHYQEYIKERNTPSTLFYTSSDSKIIEQQVA